MILALATILSRVSLTKGKNLGPFQKVGVQKTAAWSDGALVSNILQIAIKIADYLLDPKLGAGVV
jgi:hypothetical protein